MAPTRGEPDWDDWLRRWDRQQSGYMPARERRFDAMFDLVGALLPPKFVAIDLACGPGSLSQRLLHRFPRARTIAVDLDPVTLELGRHALRGLKGRMTWVEADLREPDWVRKLPESPVDAVLTTTALHWLQEDELARLYLDLHQVVRRGGVVMNGDHMSFDRTLPTFRALTDRIVQGQKVHRTGKAKPENWKSWWRNLAKEPALRAQFAERRRRFPKEHRSDPAVTLGLHQEQLRAAGFREVGVVWQELDNRVLMAVA